MFCEKTVRSQLKESIALLITYPCDSGTGFHFAACLFVCSLRRRKSTIVLALFISAAHRKMIRNVSQPSKDNKCAAA